MTDSPICVVLDPGHGGESLGAVGLNGLEEKEINLKVSLSLASELRKAGFRVVLTRDSDVDVSHENRVHTAVREEADLFLSIHHNANAQMDRTLNRSEIYVPFDLESPALDLAHLLKSQFEKRLTLECEFPLPALYNVLVRNVALSVLCEASYISCPEEEERLRKAAYRRKEVLACSNAIREYVSRGLPRVLEFKRRGHVLLSTLTDVRGEGPDPESIDLRIDSNPVEFDYNPNTGSLRCRLGPDLENGRHRATLGFRNRSGNRSGVADFSFRIDRPVCSFALSTHPRKARTPFLLAASLMDEWGRPCAEREGVEFDVPGGRVLAREKRTDGEGRARAVVEFDRSGGEVVLSAGDFEGVGRVELGRILRESYVYGRILDRRDGAPVEGAFLHVPGRIARSHLDGWYFLELPGEGKPTLEVRKLGYVPVSISLQDGESGRKDLEIAPVLSGALLGKRIVLDPLIAGTTGLTLANLELALGLKRVLVDTGAHVRLTRKSPFETPGKVERVALALDHRSEIFLSISHFVTEKPEVTTYFYYLDRAGRRLSGTLAEEVSDRLGIRTRTSLESSAYEMIQPRGVRTALYLGVKKTPEDPATLRKESLALFSGILKFLGVEEEVDPLL
jgi:N-acetylmuramoyl-L-alanine amidase